MEEEHVKKLYYIIAMEEENVIEFHDFIEKNFTDCF